MFLPARASFSFSHEKERVIVDHPGKFKVLPKQPHSWYLHGAPGEYIFSFSQVWEEGGKRFV